MEQNPPQCKVTISSKDRISGLLVAVIYQILSNLPTKNVVATTILSKRWKDKWTHCFNLDITNDDLLDPDVSFDKFVTNVIALNKSPCIKKFRLYSRTTLETDVTACLYSILRRNVEEIEIDVKSKDDIVMLPQSLFTCQTMAFLKIDTNAVIDTDIPPLIHLPSLKVFYVNFVHQLGDAVTTKLFCDMPILEDLTISFWPYQDKETMALDIFIPSLKRLIGI